MQAEHLLGSHAGGTSLWFVGLPDLREDPYYTMQPLWNAFPSLLEKPHVLLDYSQVVSIMYVEVSATGWHMCLALWEPAQLPEAAGH